MSDALKNGSRIILALDVDTVEKALHLMATLRHFVGMVKVGLELINEQLAGAIVKEAEKLGLDVFWDGKPDDVPRTIGKAVAAAAKHPNVRFINVHAHSCIEGMMAAVANKGNADILAVTALTSFETEEVELEFSHSRKAQVLQYARNAAYAGCDGIICSPQELDFLKKFPARKPFPEVQLGRLKKVIPGTRSPGADAQDQKNVTTQEVAIINGADWLVIGSEIIGAKEPMEAVEILNARITGALAEKEKTEQQKGAVAK